MSKKLDFFDAAPAFALNSIEAGAGGALADVHHDGDQLLREIELVARDRVFDVRQLRVERRDVVPAGPLVGLGTVEPSARLAKLKT